MEPKICPKRLGQAPNHAVINLDGTVNLDYQCFGELCGWFVKDEGSEYGECSMITVND